MSPETSKNLIASAMNEFSLTQVMKIVVSQPGIFVLIHGVSKMKIKNIAICFTLPGLCFGSWDVRKIFGTTVPQMQYVIELPEQLYRPQFSVFPVDTNRYKLPNGLTSFAKNELHFTRTNSSDTFVNINAPYVKSNFTVGSLIFSNINYHENPNCFSYDNYCRSNSWSEIGGHDEYCENTTFRPSSDGGGETIFWNTYRSDWLNDIDSVEFYTWEGSRGDNHILSGHLNLNSSRSTANINIWSGEIIDTFYHVPESAGFYVPSTIKYDYLLEDIYDSLKSRKIVSRVIYNRTSMILVDSTECQYFFTQKGAVDSEFCRSLDSSGQTSVFTAKHNYSITGRVQSVQYFDNSTDKVEYDSIERPIRYMRHGITYVFDYDHPSNIKTRVDGPSQIIMSIIKDKLFINRGNFNDQRLTINIMSADGKILVRQDLPTHSELGLITLDLQKYLSGVVIISIRNASAILETKMIVRTP